MGRKVLISFLGTGMWENRDAPIPERKYKTAKYQLNGEVKASSFISSVLADYIQADCIYLIGTMKSMWEEVYLSFAKKNNIEPDMDYWLEIATNGSTATYQTPINDSNFKQVENVLGSKSKVCIIKYGINEDELMFNFSQIKTLLEHLENEDEIHLDITHAFRSIPLFTTTVLMYINDVLQKRTIIKGVYYGMLDAMAEFGGIAPVVNLKKLLEIQDWIKGAYTFSNFGNGYLISELLEKDDKVSSQKIKDFTDSMQINYLHEAKKQINVMTSLQKRNFNNIADLVLPTALQQFTSRFKSNDSLSKLQFQLSIWHKDNKNYASAYIALVESIISFVCEKEQMLSDNEREQKEFRDQAKDKILKNPKYSQVKNLWASANEIRKSIAHLIYNEDLNTKKDIEKLTEFQSKFEKILYK